ncbi:MAG TPA: hypothetical protein VLM89_05740 [Phycisphaerae bacterium]|nr:hypothetical protein [Phycisphaerae bacterium]
MSAQPSEPIATRTEVAATEDAGEEPLPISFSLTYAICSDYVFRGINFSEYQNEGREKPNHQLTVDVNFDLSALGHGDLGTIGFTSWFEWFAGQKRIDPEKGGHNLQEHDYTIYWSKTLEPIKTDLTLSYSFYNYANLGYSLRQDGDRGNNNDNRSQEYSILLEHNDAWMWKGLFPDNEDGVLNPFFQFVHDVGSLPGVWLEWGVSHDFTIPGIDNLTITPSYKMAAQGSYYRHGFFLAGQELALATNYDLTPILNLPKWAGTVSVGGEIRYWQSLGQMRHAPSPKGSELEGRDEFCGGMTVNWSWGG